MRQRARLMNGVFRLISQPDQGTRIVVTIPLETTLTEQPLPVVPKKVKV
jgi:signal transduction histidine kinase